MMTNDNVKKVINDNDTKIANYNKPTAVTQGYFYQVIILVQVVMQILLVASYTLIHTVVANYDGTTIISYNGTRE